MAEAINSLSGILFINKPSGITSHDVVDAVRRKLKMKRIGHAGTLDPMATGLLIILVGQATKLSQYLMGLDKAYEGVMKLGETTNSQDADGEIVDTREVPADLSEAQVKEVMETFRGDQYQTPPMFSAKKQDGVALYKLARQGKEVERQPRFIRINEIRLDSFALPEVGFYVSCSKGTYIRTIANDIGEKLGCGAHLTKLVRTSIDRYQLEDAVGLEEFKELDDAGVRAAVKPTFQVIPARVLGGK